MVTDLNSVARGIIENNQYMTIATVDGGGKAWISPVVYAYDAEYRLYFISLPDSKHSVNISNDSKVAVAIFDSHQMFGEGMGLQIEAEITQVPLVHIPHAVSTYVLRKWPYSNNRLSEYMAGFQKIVKNGLYMVYQCKITKAWMNDPNSTIDIRVEVYLD